MTKHTPTPWKVAETAPLVMDRGMFIRCVNEGHDHGAIACVNLGSRSEEVQANARLIVKAVNCHDDLIEALTGLLEVCPCKNGCDPKDMTCATNAARAALAKAKK